MVETMNETQRPPRKTHDEEYVWFGFGLTWGELRVRSRFVGRKLKSATLWLILALAILLASVAITLAVFGEPLPPP